MMEPCEDLYLDVESLLCVRGESDELAVRPSIRPVSTAELKDALSVEVLHFLTAIASVCAVDANREYASAMYRSSEDGLTVAISGYGPVSEVVQAFVQDHVRQAMFDVETEPPAPDGIWGLQTTKSLLAKVVNFTFNRWHPLLFLGSLDVWRRRVDAARPVADNVQALDAVVEVISTIQEIAKVFGSETTPPDLERHALFQSFVDAGVRLLRVCREKWLFPGNIGAESWTHEYYFFCLKRSALVVDPGALSNNDGTLKHDFPLVGYLKNVVSVFEYTADIIAFAIEYKKEIVAQSLHFIFCTSEEREIGVDVPRVLQAGRVCKYYAVESETTAAVTAYKRFPHPAANIFSHLASIRTSVSVASVIGSSCLLCAGCSAFIDNWQRNIVTWDITTYRNTPRRAFAYPGASNKVVPGWVFPPLECFKDEAVNDIRMCMFTALTLVLMGIGEKIKDAKGLK